MLQYIIRRILIAIPTLLIISFVIFAVLALAPGDPLAQFALNPAIPESTRELIRIQFGLDQPWPIRYVRWLTSLMRGDWGFSFGTRGPVIDLIWQRLPQTLTVVGTAYLIAVLLAIPIGIISAVKQYSIFDNVATFFAFIGFSVPSFFTGLVLMLIFAINLKWFPIVYNTTLQVVDWETFTQQVRQMTLPVLVLVVQQTAALTRFMRSSMLDNLSLDYVRTARAKGLSDRMVVLRHVLVNSLIPVVTLIALGIPTIFTGAIITENLFRVNGLGALLITSINNSDTPVVMALMFIFAILTVVFNLIADILYGVLDPRVRYS
ncbi:MAG TPA: ABC transporter permease [Chloroflexus aurantiacus]|uniref:Binding-protein-dependent transport systems inner membrane component n=1 Tax=Chloroflexus aurantiacus (strain ATCC 29366 / DSM 635 / J-10-fl) TaxID=324602 RepID=A9WGA4_CHLAA|nr:ABC transporter permease [Chloroflexus aurantiacus]ABY34025.1 binding-protein-dependent transport systems inner membrane component [Chloroflexus aurantiacus J-10-fl]HBW68230.1 ABC transporter permease [Chloroflexus aurantiacus]